MIVVAAAMQKREKYKNFLSNVPILESLTEMEVMTLADSLAEESYSDGSEICKQGDEGNYFYIILQGTAACFQVDAAGNEVYSLPQLSYHSLLQAISTNKLYASRCWWLLSMRASTSARSRC